MENILNIPIRSLKGLYSKIDAESSNFGRNWKLFPVKDYANELIKNGLLADAPFMVARLGSTELACMVNYLGVKEQSKYKSVKGYVTGKSPAWWWSKSIMQQMQDWSGFFPVDVGNIERFCEMMIGILPNVDVLGSWLKEEKFFNEELLGSKKVVLEDLEPFFTPNPWTWALEGKKVLVVHPFDEAIKNQFEVREYLFGNKLLPDFELTTIPAVQSLAREKTPYDSWFDALDSMKEKIAATDFDVCILGCGAYGFPLASFVKDMGKKAIHLGGVTQLLFGIKGKRWENYIVYPYTNLYNEYWIRPGDKNRPKKAAIVESACYW
ncbi:hypothetical protein [uncultured Mucilaginibacter sp.]|uniref:hypothetical protein n=1 Tax=uncultured Mucilaginibacter sp. TaxID=797541 RepID=UPI0025CE72E5|nr:hypothetical protein [uncultured Mucilaginibacter sp.]